MRKTVITTEYSATLGAFLDSKDIEWSYKNNVITFTLPYMSPSAIFDFAVEFKDYQNKHLDMKNIKDLTENDCIHCRTQEEWDGIWQIIPNPHGFLSSGFSDLVVIFTYGLVADKGWAELRGYTIHPASDFLTPQVSVLTEVGDCKVIRHNDGCIVIKDDKAMTLTKDIVNWIKENL